VATITSTATTSAVQAWRRRAGLVAVLTALAFPVVGVLHSLARFAIAPEDLESAAAAAWNGPGRAVAGPLLTFGSPEWVYITYGRVASVLLAGLLAGVWAARGLRPNRVGGVERWAWRLLLASYGLMVLGATVSYWLTLVDEGFVLVVPGGLMVLVSSTVLGVLLVRAGSRPRLTSWLVLGAPVLVLAASSAVSLGAAFVSQAVAWGLAGWRVWLSAG
jgi:hypothetical protein